MSSSSVAAPTRPLIYISLTSFLDYAAAKDAQGRRTVVQRAKQQMMKAYKPESDFYKAPRDAIRLAKGQQLSLATLPSSPKRSAAWH